MCQMSFEASFHLCFFILGINNICFVIGLPEGSTGSQVARHNLSYIQEIGNGWFGQVFELR